MLQKSHITGHITLHINKPFSWVQFFVALLPVGVQQILKTLSLLALTK